MPPPCQVSKQNCPMSPIQNDGSSVTYPRPGYTSELLLWISLHRAQVGFALVKQQHHCRQMHSNVLWGSNVLWPAKVPSQRNSAFAHLSQAVKIGPCNKQLPVLSITVFCLSPFHLLQLFATTPAPKITIQITCIRASRNSSVSVVQFICCRASSHPLLAGFAAHSWTVSTPYLHPRRQTCSRRLGHTTTDSTPGAATSFGGPQQPHTLKDERCWDLQPVFMRWETHHERQMHVLSFPANLLSHFSALFSPTQ